MVETGAWYLRRPNKVHVTLMCVFTVRIGIYCCCRTDGTNNVEFRLLNGADLTEAALNNYSLPPKSSATSTSNNNKLRNEDFNHDLVVFIKIVFSGGTAPYGTKYK
jgi:hypothetical protein